MSEAGTSVDGERGQSTIEFALVLPLLAAVLLASVQLTLIIGVKLDVTHTAREVARIVAIAPETDPADALSMVTGSSRDLTIDVRWMDLPMQHRSQVVVTVSDTVESPISSLLGAYKISGTVTMLTELR